MNSLEPSLVTPPTDYHTVTVHGRVPDPGTGSGEPDVAGDQPTATFIKKAPDPSAGSLAYLGLEKFEPQ